MFDKSENEIINTIRDWAEKEDNIRAIVLTSSRVNSNSKPDKLSDYDIEVFVNDLSPFNSDEWLGNFGTTLVKWPLYPKNTGYQENSITRLVVFSDFPRVDFQISIIQNFDPHAYENGYKIIVDKDNIQNKIPEPTYAEFVVTKPTEKEFYETIDGFYWDLPYIAKSLKRGEIAFARYMLLSAIRYDSFEQMLRWYAGFQNNWSVNYGVHGRNLEKLLDESTTVEINSLCADNILNDIWQTTLAMEKLFNNMQTQIAKELHFQNNPVKINEVLEYCDFILALEN